MLTTTPTIRPPSHQQRDRGLQAALDAVAQQFGPAVVTSPNGTAREPDGYQRLSDLRVTRPAHDLRLFHMQQRRNQPEPDTRPAL